MLAFLRIAYRLKATPRTGWVRAGVAKPESIADHMYRMALLGFLVGDGDAPGVDRTRCILMALAHDIAEAIAGDITPNCGVSKEEKHRLEVEAITRIRDALGEDAAGAQEIYELWHEYEDGKTAEARLVKDFDKFEMIMQADDYERAQPELDLGDFFASTRGRFTTPLVQGWDQELRRQRDDRRVAPAATKRQKKE